VAEEEIRPSVVPPPGVPLDQTMAPLDYEGRDSPYRNLDETRFWVRVWEWMTCTSPPKD
jgi:hypothetical protein